MSFAPRPFSDTPNRAAANHPSSAPPRNARPAAPPHPRGPAEAPARARGALPVSETAVSQADGDA